MCGKCIGGGTPHRNNVYWDGGGTPHILCWCGEQLEWGHCTTLKEKIYMVGWVGGGWVVIPSGNNTTSWLHLASWNLPDSQLSWESKMEPSVAIFPKSIALVPNLTNTLFSSIFAFVHTIPPQKNRIFVLAKLCSSWQSTEVIAVAVVVRECLNSRFQEISNNLCICWLQPVDHCERIIGV